MTFKRLFLALLLLVLLVAAYFAVVLNWSYSTGERAGWVQKLSDKGWICKTWEGELALVSLPGTATVEKFYFTVRDDATAAQLAKAMGKRVSLHYEQKVGLPTTCFGDTRYFVTKVTVTDDISIAPGVTVPQAPLNSPMPTPMPAPAASAPR